ncbi:MAG: ferrochelatase [Gammaproteobacteria bacterium]|nr:ferrochelatase [Gammaproteobacteria bacterium]
MSAPKIGILVSNLGTPEAPTPKAVRKYLAQFLSDKRVITKPTWLWWPILHGIILRIRPKRSAHAYQKIWMAEGSPLLVYSKQQVKLLQAELGENYHVVLGMRYGRPSLAEAMLELYKSGVNKIVVLPLYPQYSMTTTASTYDEIGRLLVLWPKPPVMQCIHTYYDDPLYLQTVADSISKFWAEHGKPDKLLMSFHGLPQSYVDKGDPYYDQCIGTATKIAALLKLDSKEWQITFQSRLGVEPWLQPYTDKTMASLPADGIKNIHVVCPGFPSDCLETLEEIAMQNRDIFIENGGQEFHYIPALNVSHAHIELLKKLVLPEIPL